MNDFILNYCDFIIVWNADVELRGANRKTNRRRLLENNRLSVLDWACPWLLSVWLLAASDKSKRFNWTCFSVKQRSGHPDTELKSIDQVTHKWFLIRCQAVVCECDGLVFLSVWHASVRHNTLLFFSKDCVSSVIQMSTFIFMKIKKPWSCLCVLCSWQLHLHTVAFDKPTQWSFDLSFSLSLSLFHFFHFFWCLFLCRDQCIFLTLHRDQSGSADYTSVQPLRLN